MAIVQVYHDATIQVLVNDALSDYSAASCLTTILLLFHSIGLSSLAPQKLPDNVHLYLNSHRGHFIFPQNCDRLLQTSALISHVNTRRNQNTILNSEKDGKPEA